MRNIYSAITSNESNVYRDPRISSGLQIGPRKFYNWGFYFYIASDERFKKNDWIIDDSYNRRKASAKAVEAQGLVGRRKWRKIVLTNDDELIRTGVQELSYEALGWLVNNYRQIESVEVLAETKIYDKHGFCVSVKLHETDYEKTMYYININN